MKNRICFYVFGFPPDFSGATNQALRVAGELRKRSAEAVFITYAFQRRHLGLQHPDVTVRKFLRSESGMVLYHLKALWCLFRMRRHYDVVYLNGNDAQFWTAFYFSIFSRLFGKKLIMELNMEYPDPLCILGTRWESAKRAVSRWVDAYICLSTVIHQSMKSLHRQLDARLLFNGVDVNRFRPAAQAEEKAALRRSLAIDADAKVVVSCGAICRRKGIDFLLEVWEKVIEQKSDAKLYLLGPLELNGYRDRFAAQMLERSKEKRFRDSVVFCGCVDNVEEYFRAADIFAFAGRQEGSPNVIREAMASGLPVVALELAGITDDMVENGLNGYLVPVADQQSLRDYQNFDIVDGEIHEHFVAALVKLLDEGGLRSRLGQAGRRVSVERFSIEKQVDELLSLIGSQDECYAK